MGRVTLVYQPFSVAGVASSAVWALIVPSAIGDTVMVEVWVSGSVVSLLVLALIPGRVAEQLYKTYLRPVVSPSTSNNRAKLAGLTLAWQMYAEKMETQLILNNNAFALIQRDDNGLPVALFPIVASSVQALYNKAGELLLQFWLPNGSTWTFAYTDVIHLRNDYNENDVFGTPPGPALQSVMEVIGTTDRSIINAVRNGAVIRWLLKFTSSGMRPEDIKKQTKDFADAFLDNNNSTGVAGTDVKADAVQLEPHDYVPNALQSQNNITRLYSFFNTNEKIVKSAFSENEWISYYEAQVEPDLLQIAAEHTRKLWNRRQRAFGNKLYLESSNLQYASMSTKLSLESMVDRGAMLPNEWRAVFGLAPVAGGDEPIRRLDTAPVKQTKSGGETE